MSHREPIFNVPGVVLVLLTVFFAVHLAALGAAGRPGRLVDGGAGVHSRPLRRAWRPICRAAGRRRTRPSSRISSCTATSPHLLINSAWLLAFGTPVARRTEPVRLPRLLPALTGIAGALLYLVVNGGVLMLVVGASGAISGLMGAAFRFLFRGIDERRRAGPWPMARAPRR